MEKAKITFKNGLEIEAEVNGSCYIVDEKPEFPANLSEVTVTASNEEKILHEVEVNEAASVDGRYWFALRELTEQELKDIKTQADIQYLAMMSDIEL
jgi:hypothetical protein